MKFREGMKRTPYGSLLWRIIVGVVGGVLTLAGAVMLVAPGPGILVILAGLGVLASEFAWASRALHRTKTFAANASQRAGIPLWIKYALLAGAALVSIVVLLFYFAR